MIQHTLSPKRPQFVMRDPVKRKKQCRLCGAEIPSMPPTRKYCDEHSPTVKYRGIG